MRPSSTLLSLLLCTTLTSAWPFPPTIPNHGVIMRRQDNGDGPTATQPSTTDQPTSATDAPKSSDSEASQTQDGESATDTITKGPTQTDKQTGKPTNTRATKSGNKINPVDPPGGIKMITPASTTTTYYKIGETITFVWNYTSVQSTPSAINVWATNTLGTWTLANNQSVKETGSVVWDTEKDKNDPVHPLAMASYTLVVFDASQDVTAIPKAGLLSRDNSFRFGMYSPQAYTPLDDFVCATCNSGFTSAEKQGLMVILGTAIITVLSFTWFAGGFLGAL